MGVSGSGKSSTARLLALRLDVPFADADDMHPHANIAKMQSGRPLDDTDREPWLAEVGHWLRDRAADGTGGVVACSALKRRYRDSLRAAAPRIFFLLLTADREELLERIAARGGGVFTPPRGGETRPAPGSPGPRPPRAGRARPPRAPPRRAPG
ncbi:gluconokinase, partial [Nocardia carnea]|uniref:gluconokinase n=1 Tax=Nocardia carnea TaxID=37328 RepID=UPI0024561EFB